MAESLKELGVYNIDSLAFLIDDELRGIGLKEVHIRKLNLFLSSNPKN